MWIVLKAFALLFHGPTVLFHEFGKDEFQQCRAQRKPAIKDESAIAGRRVFEATACINCHTVRGTAANGRFGPDLTHVMSRATIASGAADNTPENLRLWLKDPDAIKPGSLMPAMRMTDAELDAVVRYMQSLR